MVGLQVLSAYLPLTPLQLQQAPTTLVELIFVHAAHLGAGLVVDARASSTEFGSAIEQAASSPTLRDGAERLAAAIAAIPRSAPLDAVVADG